jgi:hypothetical protein
VRKRGISEGRLRQNGPKSVFAVRYPLPHSSWSFLNLQDIMPTLACMSIETPGRVQSEWVAALQSEYAEYTWDEDRQS